MRRPFNHCKSKHAHVLLKYRRLWREALINEKSKRKKKETYTGHFTDVVQFGSAVVQFPAVMVVFPEWHTVLVVTVEQRLLAEPVEPLALFLAESPVPRVGLREQAVVQAYPDTRAHWRKAKLIDSIMFFFWLHGCCGELEGWARKPVNHTSWVVVVTPTDRPESARNRCVIEPFCGVVCVVTLPFWHFFWCRGVCHRTESDLFLFLWIRILFICSPKVQSSPRNLWVFISFVRKYMYCFFSNLQSDPTPKCQPD